MKNNLQEKTMPPAGSLNEHRDDEGSKLGMWLFIFTEILLFGGLFVVYTVYRSMNPVAFNLAGEQLDTMLGTINTIILLVSSMTVAMSITAIQKKDYKLSISLLYITLFMGVVFLVNKYFEWSAKFSHEMYPNSNFLKDLSYGENIFFGLYFVMTGLHALHIIVGLLFLYIILVKIKAGKITGSNFQLLENGGLYWHLVDVIWIFLFPLFYLIS